MVRTSGGIRISAGKSSKKGGGGGGSSSGGSNRSLTSTPSGKSSSKGSTRLPPIPHCEAPSWQKPITNFFNSDSSSKSNTSELNQNDHETQPCEGRENTDINTDAEAVKKTKEVIEKDSIKRNSDDEHLPEKRRKKDKTDTENVGDNSKINSMNMSQNDGGEGGSENQSTSIINKAPTEKTENKSEKNCIKSHDNSINDEQMLEKLRKDKERDKENIDGNTSN